MLSPSDIQIALKTVTPAEDHTVASILAQFLADTANAVIPQQDAQNRLADPMFHPLLKVLAGTQLTVGGSTVSFGEGNQFGDVSIGDVATGNIIKLTLSAGPQQSIVAESGATISNVTQIVQQVTNNYGTVIGQQVIQQATPTLPALHQLRAPVADFIGRHKEIKQLMGDLRSAAIGGTVAAISGVRGLGGIGKTQLAYTVADGLKDYFPDAQILVELRGASANPLTPEQALQAVIRAFEPDARLPEDLAQLQGMYQTKLTGLRVLVLADDALDERQVAPLLPLPGCALLVTSRRRFTLPGMASLDLAGLPHDEADTLLLRICPRIGAAAPALAARCGFLPLALRISASLLASDDTLPVADYLQRLDDERGRVSEIQDPENPLQSVEAVLNSSYITLPLGAQQALCQASVFPARFDRVAAEAVIVVADKVRDALGVLRRRSLIEWEEDEGEKAAYYNLHDLVRAFGLARLNDEAPVLGRYVAHYLRLAEQAAPELTGPQQGAWLTRLDQLYPHLESSLQRGDADLRLRLAAALWRYWDGRGSLRAGRNWLERALAPMANSEMDVVKASALRAEVFTGAGALARAQGDYAAAEDACRSSLALWRATGDQVKIARALNNLGQINLYLGDDQAAEEAFSESLALAEGAADRYLVAMLRCNLGVLAGDRGETDLAVALLTAGVVELRPFENATATAMYLDNLGNVLHQQGNLTDARACFSESLKIRQSVDDRWGCASAHWALGVLTFAEGQPEQAAAHLRISLGFYEEIDDTEGLIWAVEGIAMVAAAWQQYAQAARLCGAGRKARTEHDILIPPAEQKRYDQLDATLAAQLRSDYRIYLDQGAAISIHSASREARNLIRIYMDRLG